MTDRLRVILVGGNTTTAQLVADFVARPFVDVVGVADHDPAGQVADSALRFGIPFATRVDEFRMMEPAADLVIDVGSGQMEGPSIQDSLPSRSEGGPAVITGSAARLLLGLAADSAVLPETHTPIPN